ncbi:hypothetical protein MMAR_4447 [Mycobacterium marinum M]|uniref:Uncharacterized protein n=1 Tax=Mycobacterium marinum (strain ATCC BAA-535 / M) TaxID=216594 RepID=B2HDH0_MYCMM|nr:hypothetical protein [Mycobacterium marinum]ACC42854.1 hypothetical protein MMAR_4447 [Mycobacterium marinum M]
MNDQDQADHPAVTAILDSQEIVSRQGWARRMTAWDDPDRCPPIYEVVARVHRNLRLAMAAGQITYDDHAADGATYDPDDPEDSAALIHFVGSNTVLVSKRPLPGKAERGVDYHAGLLQLYARVYDFHSRGDCQIGLADDCGAGRVGGLTNMMVASRDPFVFVFRCCESCDLAARELERTRFRESLVWAQAQLPRGARIDPGSPVPPSF